jgi:biotin carboxyl carrier protein
MRPSHNAPEAPTHLRAGDLPPDLLDHLDQIEPGKRDRSGGSHGGSHHSASASRTRRRPEPEPAPLPAIPDVDDHSIVSSSRASASAWSRISRSRSRGNAAPRVATERASVGSIGTPPARPAARNAARGTPVPAQAAVATPAPVATPRVPAGAAQPQAPAAPQLPGGPVPAALPPQIAAARPPQIAAALPPQIAAALQAQIAAGVPLPVAVQALQAQIAAGQMPAAPPQIAAALPPQIAAALPPQIAAALPPQIAAALQAQIAAGVPLPVAIQALQAQIAAGQMPAAPPPIAAGAQPPGPGAPPTPAPAPQAPAPQIPAGAPPAAAVPPAPAEPVALPGGIGALDPLATPTPPELAGTIYAHIRRIALQADLAGADRVLRDALAELTSSLSCTIVYPGQDGLWTLGADDELPKDTQPLVAVATARRALIGSHTALIPVVTTTETVAVVALSRNARQPAYQPVEQIAMVALAREAAPILHHLAVQHLQRASEIKADKGSLYRGEALEAHRNRGHEGQLVNLTPGWVRRAYPMLVLALLIALGFAIFVRVPTYSTGTAVVMFEGSTSVTATLGGTVDKVFVKENEAVKKGDPLVRLNTPDEAAQFTAAETEWRDQQIQFLFDPTDEQARKQMKTAATQRDQALARVEARTIRALRDGVVTNLHVKEGVAVQPGSYVMQITDENSEIEVLAFLPSKDSPRIREKMEMQLALDGYTKARVKGTITHVQADAVSGTEAAKLGGDMLTESIARELQASTLTTTWTTARARLPTRTFKAEHNTYNYHHGMHAKVEVKIQSKPFLVTLLPGLQKYLPE